MSTTIIGIMAAAAWLYLIAARGFFWRVRDDAAVATPEPSSGAGVPARAPSLTLPRERERKGWGLVVAVIGWFCFMRDPPRWVADPRSQPAAAAGGCMLIRRATLQAIGGVDSIRHEIIDDCALAQRVKTVGRVWLGIARDTISIRQYRS